MFWHESILGMIRLPIFLLPINAGRVERMIEYITAISSAVSATAIVAIWIQTHQSVKQHRTMIAQLAADHERSRRENAVKMLFEWSQILDKKTSIARRIAEGLNDEQARALWTGDCLKLPIEMLMSVQVCLENLSESEKEAGIQADNEYCTVTGHALKELKWNVVRYLNVLEGVFTSRRYNIADRDIIDEQFGYLVCAQSGRDILAAIRKVAGGPASLPALEEFARERLAKITSLKPGKAPVIVTNKTS